MYLGIDGCKYGWICAQLKNEAISLKLIEHINDVKNLNSKLIFIDIPIGLGDQFNTRTIDFKLRKLLSKKILTSENVSFTNMICFTNNSIRLHHVNNSCSSVVTNLEFPL